MASRAPPVTGAVEGAHEASFESGAGKEQMDASQKPMVDFTGFRAWLPRADTRLGRVIGTALSEGGFAVYGTRGGGEELPFCVETFVASTELHNPKHELARRESFRQSRLVVACLPGDANEIAAIAKSMIAQFETDAMVRSLILVSPPNTSVVGVGSGDDSTNASISSSHASKKNSSGICGVSKSAERTALRSAVPGKLEVTVIRHGLLYGEGEFFVGLLGIMKSAWEGKPVPVFGTGTNKLKTTHVTQLAEAVLRVAGRVFLPPRPVALSVATDSNQEDAPKDSTEEYAKGATQGATTECSTEQTPSGRRTGSIPAVVAVCDDSPTTQIEIAATIAKRFAVPLRKFPASRAFVWCVGDEVTAAHFERAVPGLTTLEDWSSGVETLLLRFEDDEEVEKKKLELLNDSGTTRDENKLDASMFGRARSVLGVSTSRRNADSMESEMNDVTEAVDQTFAASVRSYREHFPDACSENWIGFAKSHFTEGFGGFRFRNAHLGGLGAPVEAPVEPLFKDDPGAKDGETDGNDKSTGKQGEGADGETRDETGEEPETEEATFWELAPAPVGGAPDVFKQFIDVNGLSPVRVILRGPPLSRHDEFAKQTAKRHDVPLLTPQTLVRVYLPTATDELRTRCGDPTLPSDTNEGDEGEEPETAAGEGTDSKPEQDLELTPEVLAANAAVVEEKADADAVALFSNLDPALKRELLQHALDTPSVGKFGYVMSGTELPLNDPETRATLFTHISPRPLLRLKEGWDKTGFEAGKGGDDPASGDTGDGDTPSLEPDEPAEQPPYPEETDEEAESRRALHPTRAPNLNFRLVFTDGGLYCKNVGKNDPGGYAAYVAWAETEDAALDAYELAVEQRNKLEAQKQKDNDAKRKAAKHKGEAFVEEPLKTEPAIEQVETDEVSKWLCVDHGVARIDIEASGTDSSRLRNACKALGDRARNFRGLVDDEHDPLERATLEAEMDKVEFERAEDAIRAERLERSKDLVKKRNKELHEREMETLHQRSASLRRYLGETVMPTVTDAICALSRLRPDDPVKALGEWLLRLDKQNEEEYEASRLAEEVMERTLLEDEKLREKQQKLETSRRKAREALETIKLRSVVRKAIVMPRRTVRLGSTQTSKAGSVAGSAVEE